MKALIFIMVTIFLSFPASALWGIGDAKKEDKEPKKPSLCNYSIDIGKGVFFVFEGGCDGFIHKGIIDVRKNKIIVLDDSLEKEFDSNFATPKARIEFTEKKWKGLTPVQYGNIKN